MGRHSDPQPLLHFMLAIFIDSLLLKSILRYQFHILQNAELQRHHESISLLVVVAVILPSISDRVLARHVH